MRTTLSLAVLALLTACASTDSEEDKEGKVHIFAGQLEVNEACEGEGYKLDVLVDKDQEVKDIEDNSLYVEPGMYTIYYSPQRLEEKDGQCQVITKVALSQKVAKFIEANVGSYSEYEIIEGERGDPVLKGVYDTAEQ